MIRMQARFLTDRGEPALALTKVINQRIKELGESQRNAVVATAITMLKSLRALTKVAKLGRFRGQMGKVTGNYYASYKTLGGKRCPCIRLGSPRGPELTGSRVIWLVKSWRGNADRPDVFAVNDSVGDKQRATVFVVARSAAEVKQWASENHKARVAKYRGMAKFALGYAMSKVSTRGGAADMTTPAAKSIAVRNVRTRNTKQGASYTIDVTDALNYASLALKGGEAAVAIAERRACNSVVGYINSTLKRAGSVRKPLKIPFPPGGL